MKDALITVKGFQYANGEQDTIELKTLGKFGIKNDKFYIKYTETAENGENCETLIKVDEWQTVLKRSGSTDSRMVIEVGKRNSCAYSSAGCAIILDIYGNQIDNQLNEHGGALNLEYDLNMNYAPISHNRIEITVKEV